MTDKTCTRYLTVSFGPGMVDEIEVEISYDFQRSEDLRYWRHRVDIEHVMADGVDIRKALPEKLLRKMERDILTDELTGVMG